MNGLAASRPAATISSVGAVLPLADQVPGLLGGLGLDHHDRDVTVLARTRPATTMSKVAFASWSTSGKPTH